MRAKNERQRRGRGHPRGPARGGLGAARASPPRARASPGVVSFAAVIRVVTQCSSPTNGCSLELYIPFRKLTNKDQASISWKPGPLAANVTRNMIGAAANSYMHVVGSQ